MDLIKEIEKNNYAKVLSKNGASCYQNVRSLYNLNRQQILISSYLHIINPPISKGDFEFFEEELGIKLNKDLLNFYKNYNGFLMFSGAFNIYGFGKIYKDGHYIICREENICMPYHLLIENEGKINEEAIIIGSILDNHLCYNNKTGIVTLHINGKVEQWESLNECIEDVYHRLYVQYLPNGVAKKPKAINEFIFNTPTKL